ncbi:MAG: hypothetical protein WCK75_11260 [Elusimicrobiota bacterium]
MNNQFDESSLNEASINDVETARLALRWALDKIRVLQEETLRAKQNLQEKTAQTSFLESQLKGKNSELEKIIHSHEEEMKSRQDSLEYRFRAKLERLAEREKELEAKDSRQEEVFKQKENKLQDDYQKKSDELRARWAQVEAELWTLRQEQMTKQQDLEKLYAARLDDERKRSAVEIEGVRSGFESAYAEKLSEFEKREKSGAEELKKNEAVLKWAKDSFQAETAEREKVLRQKDLDIDKKLMERNQEIEEYKIQVELLQKQISDLPEAVRKRDIDLDRYKQAMESLESVIRTLEAEKKSSQAEAEHKISGLTASLEAEKTRYLEMEGEIPRRLKIAIEHERGRLAEKLSEIGNNYKEDLRKRTETIDHLEKNLKALEESNKSLQTERDAYSHKVEGLQTQYHIKLEEFSFREKQLQSEYDVRLKVEMEKKAGALREEVDTTQRIYEDTLRLKVEEIAHLRRELEATINDKALCQTQVSEYRRSVDAIKGKAETDLSALRAQLKNAHERELADELAAIGERHAAEKQKISAAFDAQLKEARLENAKKDDDIHKFKAAVVKLEEEKISAVSEERHKWKAELQSQVSDMAKAYEDKILQLSKAIESLKAERGELMLLERERLERLYSEKEKDFDERLARKNQEVARAAELVSKKNQELDSLRLEKEAREDTYRKSLEDFRLKLSAAVDKLSAYEAAHSGLKKGE